MGGVRAQIAVRGATNCPVATVSDETDASVTDVRWTGGEKRVEEFRVDADAGEVADADAVLDTDNGRIYQFRPDDRPCACRVVEASGVPVSDVRAENGTLVLTFHLDSGERLREVVADVEAVADRVEVRYLVRSAGGDGADPTVIDRGRLTDRQREVLATAYEMGYFEYPGGANGSDVAAALGISLSTFAEHLAAAQETVLDDLLRD